MTDPVVKQDAGIKASQIDASAVVTGSDVNLSIFKPLWLRQAKILTEDEISAEILVSPAAINIPTPKFELLILPNRIQMRFFGSGCNDARTDLLRVMGGIVEMLPHTPYTGVGLNFKNVLTLPAGSDFFTWNRQVFATPWAEDQATKDNEPRFGCYFSVNTLGMRLKVDVKPINPTPELIKIVKSLALGEDYMQMVFNYHVDLKELTDVGSIIKILEKWDLARAETARMIEAIDA